MSKLEKITFRPEGEEPVEFYVLEQTRIGGHNYILVTDVEEGDGDALILKDMSQDGEEESIYDVVSDDEELEAVSGVFADMLEDVDLIRSYPMDCSVPCTHTIRSNITILRSIRSAFMLILGQVIKP